MAKGITLYLPDGDPNSVKIVELSNWSGKVFLIHRGKLKSIKDRTDINVPAVYYLFGDSSESGLPPVYIGESENFIGRLSSHEAGKDFWNVAIVFTGTLDRADVKYLENRSISLAKEAGRYAVQNSVHPYENILSEFKKSSVEEYFSNVQFIVTLLGYPLFQVAPTIETAQELFFIKAEQTEAIGTLLDTGEFKVYKGAKGRSRETPSFTGTFASLLRQKLLEEQVITHDGDILTLAEDYIFSSPSAAAAFLTGRAVNGWTAWKNQTRKTLDEVKRS